MSATTEPSAFQPFYDPRVATGREPISAAPDSSLASADVASDLRVPRSHRAGEPRAAPRRDSVKAFRVQASSLTGAILEGRYKVEGCVERDPISRTLLAEDLQTGGAVWIKLLSQPAQADARRCEALRQALTDLPSVEHPNLVNVLGAGISATGAPYLVLEAVDGEPLDRVLSEAHRLAPDVCLVLVRQVAAALMALHAAGLVHGRLSPRSLLLLGPARDPYGVKLSDYGGLRLFREAQQSQDESLLDYLAPEQLSDELTLPQSDIYALGVVLFRMLTLRLPFSPGSGKADVVARAQMRLQSPLPVPTGFEARIDPRIEAVILNATRKRPENRYAKVAELIDDLNALVGLATHDVTIRTLRVSPDLYEPETERGKQQLVLRRAQATRGG